MTEPSLAVMVFGLNWKNPPGESVSPPTCTVTWYRVRVQ